ncbi:MAG: hypothetical protein JKY95_04325 [Planctomycetaceae bacterium]|nr:hypothetical protein [Planctomycetaceae bacterium]
MFNYYLVKLSVSLVVLGMLVNQAIGKPVDKDQSEALPFTERELVSHVFDLAEKYLQDFQHSETHVLYGSRLSTRKSWTSPEDVKKDLPKPWGYGSRIADTALHCGHLLVALLDAYEARPDPFLKAEISNTFQALKFIGSLPEKHPKPNKPALVGLVPRGPHPDDATAYFDDSSMDQHTTYIISLALYSRSSLASEKDKQWIRESLGKVGQRLEKNGWSIKQADGVTQAHVGFSWTGYNSDHASILLPAVLALYQGTGDEDWLEVFEKFLSEKEGIRWKNMHPGPHVKINGHPIYANQNALRVNAFYQLQKDEKRKSVLKGLLTQSAEMQMERDFPGPFYEKFHTDEQWAQLREDLNWEEDQLHGCNVAWKAYQPKMLDLGGLPVLAHVRFPLGGFHMVMLSENPEMIRENLDDIWKMLTTVDLKKIDAGETNYLFTVVALHTYAFYFRHAQLSASSKPLSPENKKVTNSSQQYGKELALIKDVGIGPCIDVDIQGNFAYAIGRSKLSILDISNPKDPHVVGTLSGLGGVRQILAHNGIAYITSRQDGLYLVNVKNPSQPKVLFHYDTIEFATGIEISGDVLFVACRNYGVELIDVSIPSEPTHLSTIRTGEAQSIVARGTWLYVGVWATSEVVAVDVLNPRQPKITARVPLDGFGDGVDVQGDFLYVATGHHSKKQPRRQEGDPGFGNGHGLEIFNISDPASPQFISRVKFPRLYNIGNDLWDVTVVDDYVFVADTHNGIFIVDVSHKKQPVIINHRKLPYNEASKLHAYVGGLDLADDSIYVAGGETDLHVIAAPQMAHPVTKEPATPPVIEPMKILKEDQRFRVYSSVGQIHAVDFYKDRAIIACGSDGVHVANLWPAAQTVSKLKTKGFVTDVAVSQNQVMIAAGTDGLLIAEISDDGQLALQGKYQVKGQAIKQVEVSIPGKYVMVQVGANHLHIVDISNPTAPKQVLKDARHGLLYGDQMMRGLAEERYACVFWHVSGLHWFDMLAKPHPVFSGDSTPFRIGASNGLIEYKQQTLATVRGGYMLLDRQDRRPLDQQKVYRIGKKREHLGKPSIFGNKLYIANRDTGIITIADISDISQPKLIEQIELPGNPGRVIVHNKSIIIPDGYHGLLISNNIEDKK